MDGNGRCVPSGSGEGEDSSDGLIPHPDRIRPQINNAQQTGYLMGRFITYQRIKAKFLLLLAFSSMLAYGYAAHAGEHDFSAELKEDFFSVEKYNGGHPLHNLEMETMERDPAFLIQDKEKLSIIVFWASWCGVCQVDLPTLKALQDERSDIRIIYVGENKSGYDEFRRMVDKIGLPLEDSYYDARSYIKRWLDIRTVPTILIVSPDGQILYRLEGDGDWESAYMKDFLTQLNGKFGEKVKKP